MRLPLPQFRVLCGSHFVSPEVFGLTLTGYDGAPHLEVVDPQKLRLTLHALEESLGPNDRHGIGLYHRLRGMVALAS